MSFNPITLAMMKKQLPCYDTRKTESITIAFPVTPSTEEWILGDKTYYKISEKVPNFEEITTGWVEDPEGRIPLSEISVVGTTTDGTKVICVIDACLVVLEDNGDATRGIWCYNASDMDGVTLCFPFTTGELKTIDPKFLPSGGAIFDVYFDMMGLMSGSNLYMYKTSETGDTTQRVTAEELHKALTDNKTFRVIMVLSNAPEGTIAVFAPISVTAMPSMGAIGILLDAGSLVTIYTAEYTG